jgi:hypothetical protein
MKVVNSFGIKVVACAGIAMALTLGLSWSFVESTAAVSTLGGDNQSHTVSVGGAHGGAPLAPFGAALPGRSATLVS